MATSDSEERARLRREEAQRQRAEAAARRAAQAQANKAQEEAALAREQATKAKAPPQQPAAQQQPAATPAEPTQRGYDPRFDDPDYGKSSKPEGNVTAPANRNGRVQEQAQPQETPPQPNNRNGRYEAPEREPEQWGPLDNPAQDVSSAWAAPWNDARPERTEPEEKQGWGAWASDKLNAGADMIGGWVGGTPGYRKAEEESEARWAQWEEEKNADNTYAPGEWQFPVNPLDPVAGVGAVGGNVLLEGWRKGREAFTETDIGEAYQEGLGYVDQGLGYAGNVVMDGLGLASVPADIAKTEVVIGSDNSIGEGARAAYDALAHPSPSRVDDVADVADEVKQNYQDSEGFWGGAAAIGWGVGQLATTHLSTAWDDYVANKEKFAKVRQDVEKSDDPHADFALLNVYSGVDAQMETLASITNQEENVERMRQEAQKLKLEANDPNNNLTPEERREKNRQAAEVGMKATKLANMSASDLVTESMNFFAEMAGTLAIDPLNYVNPISVIAAITPEARRMAQAIKFVDITPEKAAEKLTGAIAALPKDLIGSSANTFAKDILPWAATPDSRASQAANVFYQTFSNLFNGVRTNDEARVIVNALADDPTLLINGAGDAARGAGAIANQNVINNINVLEAAADGLKSLKSLVKEGDFDIISTMSEIDNLMYNTGKSVHGVTDPSLLAQVVRAPDKLQRGLMSEMWLAMRPTHWIRNAASAAFHLTTDGIMTFLPKDQLLGDLKRIAGSVPEQWMAEALGDVERGVSVAGAGEMANAATDSMLGKTPVVGPFLDKLVKGGNWVWTDINSPIGEANFRLRGYTVPFKRAFEQVWDTAVSSNLSPALEQLGVNPEITKSLVGVAQDAARTGGRAEAVEFFRKAIDNSGAVRSLAELGVTDGILNNQTIKAIYDVVLSNPGANSDSVMATLNGLLDADMGKWLSIVGQSPPQPGRQLFTAMDNAKDAGRFIDDMVAAAKRAGVDPEAAKAQAAGIMQTVQGAEMQNVQAVLDEAVRAASPDAMRVATDFWQKLMAMKDEARQATDAMSKAAIDAGVGPKADALWQAKSQGMTDLYTDWPQRLQALADEARIALDGLAKGEPLPPRGGDMWDMMDRLAQLDPRSVEAARSQVPGSVKAGGETYKNVIQANRDFVDMYAANTYGAMRRYPGEDAVDLFMSAEQDIQAIGSQAAGLVKDLQEQLKNGAITPERFYAMRNKVWFDAAGASATRHMTATREIVLNGEAQKTATKLAFADASGQKYRLVAMEGEAAQVRNAAGDIMEIPVAQVPPQVLADFRGITGQANDVADGIVKDIIAEVRAAPSGPQAPPRPRNPISQQAGEELTAARESRDTMRDAWDRVAVGEVGTPKLDSMILSYKRNGIIRFSGDFPYEDLLGRNVGGYQMDTQADVERFLTEYSKLYDSLKGSEDVIKDARQYVNMAKDDIVAARGDDLRAMGFTDDDLAQMNKEEVLGFLEGADGQLRSWDEVYYEFDELNEYQKAIEANPYHVDVSEYNWLGLQGTDGNLAQFVGDANRAVQAAGGTDLQIGKMAQWQIEEINKIRAGLQTALPELLNGTREGMSQAQKLRALDAFKATLPHWDNAVAAGQQAGTALSNFAMLDFASRRNVDTWLSLFMPYHYWKSRSAFNWAERTIYKPHILAAYNKVNDYVERTGEREGNSASKVGNKLPVGDSEYWIANGLNYVFPFDLYGTNSYANPDEAQTMLRKTQQSVSRLTGGMLPALEEVSQWWENPDDFDPGTLLYKYSPYVKLGADIYRYKTGKPLSWAHDAYDEGRVANEIAVRAQAGEVDPTLAKYAQDVAYQIVSGLPALPEQPEEAGRVYEEAAKQMGFDSVVAWVGANILGIPVRHYTQTEQEMREASYDYRLMGYDPVNNPTGSKDAQRLHLEQNPGVTPRWSVGSTYPGSDEDPDFIRPGAAAANEELGAAKDQVYDDMGGAVEQFLAQNPEATRGQVSEVKGPFYDKATATEDDYPSALAYSGGAGTGYSPEEQQAANQQRLLASVDRFPGKPERPADGAPAEEMAAYYREMDAWDQQRMAYLEKVLKGPTITDPDAQGLYPAGPQTAAERYFDYETRYAGPNEKAWAAALDEKEQASDAEWTQNYRNIEDRLGDSAVMTLATYYQTPKGEERKAFAAEHPELGLAFLAMDNPQHYDQLIEQYGKEAVNAWASSPRWDANDPDGSKVKVGEYWRSHPEAANVKYWIEGRPKPENTPYEQSRSYGAEYEEAKALFGDDIWDTHIKYNSSWDKATKAKFYAAHPNYSAFNGWFYEYKDTVYQGPAPAEERAGPLGTDTGMGPEATPLAAPPTGEDPATPLIYGEGNPYNEGWVSGKDASYYQNLSESKRMESPGYRAYVETQGNIRNFYGEEGAALWDTYMDLPKGGEERKAFQAENPQIKAIRMAAYEPEAYAQAVEMFGGDAWDVWANIPPYDEENADASRAVREDYYSHNPAAKLMGAWVYGRPSESRETTEDSYDFGADYASAIEQFGENIWNLYSEYSSQWDKEKKKKFYEDNPQFDDFFDWWYGDSGEAGKKHSSGSFGGRRFGGGGVSVSGAFGAPFTYNGVRARLIDKSLLVDAPRGRFQAPRPQVQTRIPDIGPERIEPWRRAKSWARK